MAAVTLSNVSKYHNQQLILDSLNLSIEKGEFLAVIGPSGCGKSTLLRLITGLDEVSHGEILINEQCVNQLSPAKRDMAMVFQSYALYPHMTVFNNIAYSLKMRGVSKQDIQNRVEQVATLLELTALLDRKPAALSGGQRQRVAMGRAIIRNPAVFLFDEPLSNLDAKLRFNMRQEIKKLHQTLNTTCIYVTHDQSEAMGLADRILVLNKGKIEQIGAPDELYNEPASLFVAEFIGAYPINQFSATLQDAPRMLSLHAGLTVKIPENCQCSAAGEVTLAVRAEALILCERTMPDALAIEINLVENLGADQLIHAQSLSNAYPVTIRIPANQPIPLEPGVRIPLSYANLYDTQTGLRLGGWTNEKSNNNTY